MITISDDMLEKIDLLDSFLSNVDVDDLKELNSRNEVVAKLKGTDRGLHLLRNLLNENEILRLKVARLEADTASLKYELTVIMNEFKSRSTIVVRNKYDVY